jgi:hypothetical protein
MGASDELEEEAAVCGAGAFVFYLFGAFIKWKINILE